ncbi:zinc-dependent alcohol dehydrogenase [Kushneria indalinina]|uniref:Threonine dehydrogenase-like Zn-dependent dehydrogenase n=1 Tax=Kushneria indalinina DSM 14324 TaxID=1122140 RepID=A0A3D9DYI8_9GAMM|nr:zinc-binding alcohol dehydrogenase [Kushneria indalinina]REC95833.1 threonine dehydrogenase-like Zn-dependent dehydrogenase [Kushneria indalinina DSM 14324]
MSSDNTARAFWVEAPGQGVIRTQPLAVPGPNEARVRTCYSAISRGTETLVFHGRVPESEHARMRAPFQEGDFPGPVKYGYSSVGVVEVGPRELEGRYVFCLHPHQDRYVAPAAMLIPLPDGLPAERAVLAANMETALNGLWDAAPRIGDRIAVIGAGVVGTLMAWLCRNIPGTRVELIDIDDSRKTLARALDIAFSTPAQAQGECDLVIHASGSQGGLQQALTLAGQEATIIEMSWFGAQSVSLPLGEAFHSRRLTLRASQVGTVSPSRAARRTHGERMTQALSLLEDDRLDILIDAESAFEALPETMARVTTEPGTLCHRIRYST